MDSLKILKIRDVKPPIRAHSNDAGIDFFIPNDFKKTILNPNESILIPSGIKVLIPKGYALIAFNKSSIASKKNLIVGACVIDESYQGEIYINLINIGKEPQVINPGDKIIQFICLPINYVKIEEVTNEFELYNGIVTTRGEGGFGSTGLK